MSGFFPLSLGGTELLGILAAYLLGSVPFGLLFGFLRGVDIRKSGSGNIGATNVGRALGRPWALLAFACDFGKGWVSSAWIGPWVADVPEREALLATLCAGGAVLGHVWPLYLRFKGGKAVATGCGGIVGIDPVIFLGGGVVWLLTTAVTRYVGLASILMGLAFPVLAWWRSGQRDYGMEVVLGTALLALLILVRHRANISRMLAGTESRIGQKKSH